MDAKTVLCQRGGGARAAQRLCKGGGKSPVQVLNGATQRMLGVTGRRRGGAEPSPRRRHVSVKAAMPSWQGGAKAVPSRRQGDAKGSAGAGSNRCYVGARVAPS